ncbi:5-formyltetrahydrofolate cyclo-ligase [Streptomyces coryli]|uniref:5-formyltetrahydrofolate cyclo-ligase n=1 Tax=Streptomyces coryli TaxID=1128680 RepID=UPI001F0F6F95|nr:5-formyltetrahydrofolate cyclo-ligase [Streptomyces coryli]
MRERVLAVRAGLPPDDLRVAGAAIARRAVGLPELAAARTVAAYVSVGREPSTRELIDTLRDRGTRVLLPVLRPDNDLDWAAYEGADSLVRARRGLLEPSAAALGVGAVTEADVVLLPGLAVDRRGLRLGRGGGSYDRVLARLAGGGFDPALVVVLYDDEVVEHVPAEPHDRSVRAAVTPSALHRFPEARPT